MLQLPLLQERNIQRIHVVRSGKKCRRSSFRISRTHVELSFQLCISECILCSAALGMALPEKVFDFVTFLPIRSDVWMQQLGVLLRHFPLVQEVRMECFVSVSQGFPGDGKQYHHSHHAPP